MKLKITTALVLCLVLVVSCFHTTASGEISPQYSHTRNIRASLSFDGDKATSSGGISPKSSDDVRKVRITVYLQRNENGVWITIDSWKDTQTNCKAQAVGEKTVSSGYQYRTYAVGTISTEEGVLLERVSATSKTVSH